MANVGLDFGTHQTKVCIEQGEDISNLTYTFFTFKDLEGNDKYYLPSTVQINKDDTLSYGYTDESNSKTGSRQNLPEFTEKEPVKPVLVLPPKPEKVTPKPRSETNLMAAALSKAMQEKLSEDNYRMELKEWEKQCDICRNDHVNAMIQYYSDMPEYLKKLEAWEKLKESASSKMIYRNFKQATFLDEKDYPWPYDIKPEMLSVWYLTYVLFKLDEYFSKLAEDGVGDGTYSLQVGVPTGKNKLKEQQKKAISIFVSAFKLMESYNNDFSQFMSATVSELLEKTTLRNYRYNDKAYMDDKYYYNINVFPEAYAGLFVMTANRALASGFNLLVDIGGGTTDITFFAANSTSRRPMIYNYDSVPKGLNFLIESAMPIEWDKMSSHPDIKSSQLDKNKLKNAIEIYEGDITQSTNTLLKLLWKEWNGCTIKKESLNSALNERPIIYTGGGSVNDKLPNPIEKVFTDLRRMDGSEWSGLYIIDIKKIKRLKLCPILSVSLGLAITQDNDDIDQNMFTLGDIFNPHRRKDEGLYDYGRDKDLQDL